MIRFPAILFAALLLVPVWALIGCATSPKDQTRAMEQVGVVDVKTRQLDLLVQGLGAYCAGEIELAAQEIQDQTGDPMTLENAIMWKVNAVPLFYQASFTPDPVGGLVSIWALSVQMRQFMTTGEGRVVFGAQQYIGVTAAQNLVARTEILARKVMTEEKVEYYQQISEEWAKEYPIQNMLFVHPGESHNYLMALADDGVGGLAAAASLNQQMMTMNDRIATFTTSVPKQVQWQTELMLTRTPNLIEAQRDSTLLAIRQEYIAMLEPMLNFLHEERLGFTKDLERERVAVLEVLEKERLQVLQSLTDQLILALDRISAERTATIESINESSRGTVAQVMGESEELTMVVIDRIFSKMVQVMILPSLVLLSLVVVAMFMLRNAHRRHLEVLAVVGGESIKSGSD